MKIFTKIKYQLKREGWAKQNMIRDREERWALESILECCDDPIKVAGLVRLRLGHLDRRAKRETGEAKHAQEDRKDTVSTNKGEQFTEVETLLRSIVTDGSEALRAGHPAATVDYWEALAAGRLHLGGSQDASQEVAIPQSERESLQAQLGQGGYLQCSTIAWGAYGVDLEAIAATMEALKQAGWPPGFIFMYDEAWALARVLWGVVQPVLGHEVELEPSLTAFQLSTSQENDTKTIGKNFGWPHRDYNFSESNYADGTPKCLSIWLPVTDATLDNGCMYVVPKEFDPEYELDGSYGHMRPAIEGSDSLSTELRFGFQGSRALPAPAGTVLAWHGNLVHWGSPCHCTASTPRASLAFTFRRSDVESMHTKGPQKMKKSETCELNLSQRLQLACQSIMLYKSWYTSQPSFDVDAIPPLLA